ncbi:hypothetical protein GTW20_24750 [Nocardiopsis alba]|uniref:Uncharacterized protein n=2 Tax=Nocardiopsis alba TaxID=53437 RepID=A0A7K2IZJ9_9ACTN|nr:hypothetical protein [Nocardiopsis alba]
MVSDAPTPEALAAFAAYRELERELLQSGESVSGEGLGHPVVSTTVRRGEKGVVATDGPFVELKEVLASFAVIDVAGHERAVEIRPRTRSRRLFGRATGVGRSMGFPRIRGVGRSGSVIAGWSICCGPSGRGPGVSGRSWSPIRRCAALGLQCRRSTMVWRCRSCAVIRR